MKTKQRQTKLMTQGDTAEAERCTEIFFLPNFAIQSLNKLSYSRRGTQDFAWFYHFLQTSFQSAPQCLEVNMVT